MLPASESSSPRASTPIFGQSTDDLCGNRIRKVKCDEMKPFCLRCTKTGRRCDGYIDPRALAGRKRLKDGNSHDHLLGHLLEHSAPEEKRAFYFFQHVTARSISGDFDTAFWRITVLQISQTEPAVRHAVLAVSSLHEGLVEGVVAPLSDEPLTQSTSQSFALQQYNKAISRLLAQMSNPLTKPLASLLTCVLFVCIEYMQGKDNESLIHLEQGRQLLARLDHHSNDPEMQCIVQNIVPLYTRLSLTSFLFGGSPVPIPDSLKQNSDIPDTFETFDNMRHCMHDFMEQAFRFTHRARPAKNSSDTVPRETMRLLEVEQDRLLSRLARLNVAFLLFKASRSQPGPESALVVLQMYLHAQHVWISTALSSSEVVYDDFLSSFAAIVPLAATYLDLESSTQQRPTAPEQRFAPPYHMSRFHTTPDQVSVAFTSNFTFETHIIPPLYYVAAKCRHPLIRRSALQLLNRNSSRRENLWRASVMGALAGHIVSVEEHWAQEHRFSVATTDSAAGNTAFVSPNGPDPEAPTDNLSALQSSRTHHGKIPPFSDCSPGFGTGQDVPDTTGPTSISTLSFVEGLGMDISYGSEPPLEPSLLLDAEISSSLSHAPSLIASLEDGYASSPAQEPAMAAFVTPPTSHSETWMWQQQQEERRDVYQPSPQLAFSTSVSYETAPAHHGKQHAFSDQAFQLLGDYISRSGSSDISSSVDLDEHQQQHYHTHHHKSGGPPTHQQAPPAVHLIQQQQPQGRDEGGGFSFTYPNHIVTEAPFGLPEELRVHDAIIGPEREDGSWVAIFRKLHGVEADWDVQHDWVPTRKE